MTIVFLEKPQNPGLDDGKCALCETQIDFKAQGLDSVDDFRCAGCGYLICGDDECAGEAPWGAHLVVSHQQGDDTDGGW